MLRRIYLSARAQSGTGLVEVSISLLVLAVGTLGLGSLQIASKRMGFEAVQRGEAALLAADLLERMRANRVALAAYNAAGIGEGSGTPVGVPQNDCRLDRCSPAQRGAWDIWSWQQALDGASTSGGGGGLVRPTACVVVTGRSVTVEIAWQGFRPVFAELPQGRCGAGNYGPDDVDRQWLQVTSWIGEE